MLQKAVTMGKRQWEHTPTGREDTRGKGLKVMMRPYGQNSTKNIKRVVQKLYVHNRENGFAR